MELKKTKPEITVKIKKKAVKITLYNTKHDIPTEKELWHRV